MATSTANAYRGRTNNGGDALARYLEEISRHPLLDAAEEIELAQTIEAGNEAIARLESKAASRHERLELERKIQCGREAEGRFVAANLRLVVANARRRPLPPGIELLDAIQEGNIGLLRAVEKFDWRRGFKFSTYATWWIRQAINKAVLDKARTVRIPGRVVESLSLVRRVHADLTSELGRPPRVEEVAAESGLTTDRVRAAMTVPATVSLDAPVGEDGAILADFISDDEPTDVETAAELADVADRLRKAVARLPEREGRIVTRRYGLIDGTPRAFDDIGGQLGLTAERIRQLEKRALCRLRHPAFGLGEADLF
jgi:RNA polymerase sigma factor (sigma-70 family)